MMPEAIRAGRSSRWGLEVEAAVRRLGGATVLSLANHDTVMGLIGPVEMLPTGRELVREMSETPRAGLIVSGWACRQRMLPDGRRQIFDLLVPGDFIGIAPTGPLGRAWTVCLTKVELADAEPLRRRLADSRASGGDKTALGDGGFIAAAFDLQADVELLRMLDQVVRLGTQTAYERTGHLFLELHDRARAAGYSDGGRFDLPLTQEVLADVLGLSVVHVNRVLQQLKREKLIELHGGRARLLDPMLLAQVCDFSLAA